MSRRSGSAGGSIPPLQPSNNTPMATVLINPAFKQIRGRVGNMVFRQRNGRSQAFTHRPRRALPPTASQLAVRDKFMLAASYAKHALLDPATKAFYAGVGAQSGKSAYAAAMSDCLRPPVIVLVDLIAYQGYRGGPIRVLATDD